MKRKLENAKSEYFFNQQSRPSKKLAPEEIKDTSIRLLSSIPPPPIPFNTFTEQIISSYLDIIMHHSPLEPTLSLQADDLFYLNSESFKLIAAVIPASVTSVNLIIKNFSPHVSQTIPKLVNTIPLITSLEVSSILYLMSDQNFQVQCFINGLMKSLTATVATFDGTISLNLSNNNLHLLNTNELIQILSIPHLSSINLNGNRLSQGKTSEEIRQLAEVIAINHIICDDPIVNQALSQVQLEATEVIGTVTSIPKELACITMTQLTNKSFFAPVEHKTETVLENNTTPSI